MTTRLALPLGHPPPELSEAAARAHLQQATALLAVDDGPFDARTGLRRCSVAPTAADAFRVVRAPTEGPLELDSATGAVLLQLPVGVHRELALALGPDVPAPTLMSLGPVDLTATSGPVRWTTTPGGATYARAEWTGAPVGRLRGAVLDIGLRDARGFRLDPLAWFQRLAELELWDLPDAGANPLLGRRSVPLAVRGPTDPHPIHPHLVLRGGSLRIDVHAPPDPLPARWFSFLTSDTLEVDVAGVPAGVTAHGEIRDVSSVMYRTRGPRTTALPLDQAVRTHDLLRPHHEQYRKANGKKKPGDPLAYEITVSFTGVGAPAPLRTRITQDARDVIRQEYVFHGALHQDQTKIRSEKLVDAVADRADLAQDRRGSANFTPAQMAWDNYAQTLEDDQEDGAEGRQAGTAYGPGGGGWMLNASEAYRVAEFMNARYREEVLAGKAADPPLFARTTPEEISVNSSWRNPERNESAGGVPNSNHQHGRALDLEPRHAQQGTKAGNPEAAPYMLALYQAGLAFLEDLAVRNAPDALSRVEVLVEHFRHVLFRAEVKGGVRREVVGKGWDEVITTSAPAGLQAALERAAAHATHLHVGWQTADPSRPLELPPLPPEPVRPPPPYERRSLVLLATEAAGVPRDEQLPVTHAAHWIKELLERTDPGVPVDVVEVTNPVAALDELGAFTPPTHRWRYVFTIGHAYPLGLVLQNEGTHDPVVWDQMQALYGPGIVQGGDDLTEFRTFQLRPSNLRQLPRPFRDNLRAAFSEAAGVYLLGCRTSESVATADPTMAKELAQALRVPVWGASFTSLFMTPDEHGEWVRYTASRLDPVPLDRQVVLVPRADVRATLRFVGARLTEWQLRLPQGGHDAPAPVSDVLEVYRSVLVRSDP